jgi:GntR family transcriptional regulator
VQKDDPKYLRIAKTLRAQIDDWTFPPGALLPSRNEICAGFGVSAAPAQKALALLCQQGYARAVQGRGHIVRRPRSRIDVPEHIHGPEARAANPPIQLDHASVYAEPLSDNIAIRLDVAAGTLVWVRHALYNGNDGQPIQVHVSWIPEITADQAEQLRDIDPHYPDWPTAIKGVTGREVTHVEQTTRPRLVKEWEAEALGLEDTAVVLVVHATAFDATGTPVEHTRVTWPRTAARIKTTYTYQAPEP